MIQNTSNDGQALFPSYIFHLSKDGKLDSNFGDRGLVRFNDLQARSYISVVKGKLIIVQQYEFFDQFFLLFQYELNGSLMPGYDKKWGKVLRRLRAGASYCSASTVLTDEFIYTAGSCKGDASGIVITRYRWDGALEQSYGANQGQVFLPLTLKDPDQFISFSKLTELKNGEIVVSGGIGWGTKYIYNSSVATFHLDSTGGKGKWGTDEYSGIPSRFLREPWSAADEKGQVLQRFTDLRHDDFWSLTTSMK